MSANRLTAVRERGRAPLRHGDTVMVNVEEPVAVVGTNMVAPAEIVVLVVTVWVVPFVVICVPEGTRKVCPLTALTAGSPATSVIGEPEDATSRVNCKEPVKAGLEESVTVTLKVLVPATVGFPESRPPVLSVRPVGSEPLLTAQL